MPEAPVRFDHRPWPRPEHAPRWRQRWHNLLFAHWPVPAAALRPLIPLWLEIDEHSGSSWVGIVPFSMTHVTLRRVPPLPFVSAFAELNLRLYVTRDGRPGIWFISLDAARLLAVWAARWLVHLPYFHAEMSVRVTGDSVSYRSARRSAPEVRLEADYRATEAPFESVPGSLESFLTDRYCLYTQDRSGRRYRLEIDHAPWPLQLAEAEFRVDDVATRQGIALPDTRPLLHFSRRLDVVGWGLDRLMR